METLHCPFWVVGITLLFTTFVNGQSSGIECPLPNGQAGVTEGTCSEYSACEWVDSQCVMSANDLAGYTVTASPQDTGRGFKVALSKIDPSRTMYDSDIVDLELEVIYHEDHHVQVKVTDPSTSRYEVPVPLSVPETPGESPMYEVKVSDQGLPFTFSVIRRNTSQTIFQTEGPLSYEDQFIQLTTRLSSSYLYGFGENSHTTFRHQFEPRVTYPMFSKDQPNSPTIINQYGVHPYYQVVEDNEGNTHSVLFMNSNAQEYSTFLLEDGSPALTLRTIGGIVDLHFFLGPTPEEVNAQYIGMIGTPAFPPYWSLGFQLSRYGYTGVDHVRRVRQAMKDYGIPQDVQTFDIDYMERFRDFTYDNSNWMELPELIEELHNDDVKVTLILDPALVIDWENYEAGSRGLAADAYVKWMSPDLVPADQPEGTADYLVGYVWPDTKTVFPDFMKPSAMAWWAHELVILHETLEYDAIWIDMNEPANFGTNMDKPFNYPADLEPWSLKCPYNSLDSPPFPTITTYLDSSESNRISDKTICMSTVHTDGNTTYLHYDVHSLYGLSETIATYQGLTDVFPNKRPVVLSRSTFPGSGKYAVHWLGDNTADWTQLAMSVIGLLEFNMFGIPMVGADICGFFNEPSEELCIRWMQLGAFYPFSRNHNTLGTADQDPTTSPALAEASREVLLLRYRYLPHLYTLFHKTSMHGYTVVRPMLNLAPDEVAARDVDTQFSWGSSIMVAPVLLEGAVDRDVYFTSGIWYDLVTGALVSNNVGGERQTVAAPLETIPVFVKGGAILPQQEPASTTTQSRLNPYGLTIALGAPGVSSGDLFWDDGETLEHSSETSYMASFSATTTNVTSSIRHGAELVSDLNLEYLSFYGYPVNPTAINVNGAPLDAAAWTYDDSVSVLTVTFSISLGEELQMTLA